MSLFDTVKSAITKELDRVSEEIQIEMTTIVAQHNKSGAAVGAIHIENMGEFTRFVGGTNGTGTGKTGTDHLAMLDDGNGSGGIPKGGRKPKAPMPMTYGYGVPVGGFAMRASNYAGIHFTRTIKNKHS